MILIRDTIDESWHQLDKNYANYVIAFFERPIRSNEWAIWLGSAVHFFGTDEGGLVLDSFRKPLDF